VRDGPSASPDDPKPFWIVIENGVPSARLSEPGFEVDVMITSGLESLYEVWLGRLSISDALRAATAALQRATSDRDADAHSVVAGPPRRGALETGGERVERFGGASARVATGIVSGSGSAAGPADGSVWPALVGRVDHDPA